MRLTAAMVLISVGLAFPAPLNGQAFTNSLLGLACTCAAVALALGPARDRRSPPPSRMLGWSVVALGGLFLALLAAQLRPAYRLESGFNRRVRELRQTRGAPREGTPHVDPAVR